MESNKKGQIANSLYNHLGVIIFVTAVLVVLLVILWIFVYPALGKTLKWVDFW